MTTTPNMLLTLPTDHDSADVWGALILTIFGQIDAHDHQPGKGVKVPSNGLNINADLSFSSNSATNVEAVDFAAASTTAVSAFAGALFLADGTGGTTANELYWRTTSGSNVKLTNGPALNVAAFAGGIGGDYVSVGAAIAFDDANKRYTFKDGTTNWARLASGEVRIFETGTTDTVFVGQAAPAALAVSYTMTWPTALPAATKPVWVSSAGQFQFSAPTQTLTISWASLAPNAHVVLDNANGAQIDGGSGTLLAFAPINLVAGSRVSAIRARIRDNSSGTNKVSFTFESLSSTLVKVVIGTSNQSLGNSTNQTVSLTGLSTTITAGLGYIVNFVQSSSTTCQIMSIEVDYDVP